MVEYRKDERGTRAREIRKGVVGERRGVGIRAGEWSRTYGEKRGGETGRRDVMFLRAGWEKLSVTSSEAVSFRRCTPIRYDVFSCEPCVHISHSCIRQTLFRNLESLKSLWIRLIVINLSVSDHCTCWTAWIPEFRIPYSFAILGGAWMCKSLSRVQVNVSERIKGFDRNKSAWCYCQVMVPDEKTIDQVLWSM